MVLQRSNAAFGCDGRVCYQADDEYNVLAIGGRQCPDPDGVSGWLEVRAFQARLLPGAPEWEPADKPADSTHAVMLQLAPEGWETVYSWAPLTIPQAVAVRDNLDRCIRRAEDDAQRLRAAGRCCRHDGHRGDVRDARACTSWCAGHPQAIGRRWETVDGTYAKTWCIRAVGQPVRAQREDLDVTMERGALREMGAQ